MIRVNLLKSLQPDFSRAIDLEPPPSRAKAVILTLILVGLAGSGIFFWVQSSRVSPVPAKMPVATTISPLEPPAPALESAVEEPVEASAPAAPVQAPNVQVAEPVPVPEVRTPPSRPRPSSSLSPSQAVEDVVREVEEEIKRAPRQITYDQLGPSDKIVFQHRASANLMGQLKRSTPPKVGFSHVIVTLPGDLYVHGLAYDEDSFRRLKSGLEGGKGASVRQGIFRPAGERGTAMEFSLYGKIESAPGSPSGNERIASKAQVQQELQAFVRLAQGHGVKLDLPQSKSKAQWGNLERQIFRTQARCSYQQLESFLSQLPESTSKVGLLKIALRAQGDDSMAASLDLVVYVGAGGG